MNTSPHTIRRLALATGLAASLAVLAVPTALAGGQSDALDPAIAVAIASHRSSLTVADGGSREALDSAIAAAVGAQRAG
jgi:hypothetical protein